MSTYRKALVALSLGCLFSTSAFAENDKVFSGAGCQWESVPGLPENRTNAILSNNSPTTTRWAVCPVVRDSVGLAPEYFAVVTGNDVPNCRLIIRLADGLSLYSANHGVRVNLGGGRHRFEWFTGTADGPNYTNAAYSLLCQLTPWGYISSYQVSENE